MIKNQSNNHKKQKNNNTTKRSNYAASLYLHYKGEIFKMATKLGTQKQVEIEGVTYTLQHPGQRGFTQIQDRCQMSEGRFSSEKFSEEIFKHVVVDPKVSWDYFDGNEDKGIEAHEGYEELIKEASTFLRTGKTTTES